ncbi:MAG: carboxypeptidase-like regulatory domain-containing protein [Muribaculaceae bacterium]|nr:carboxypeptidase-like regulatory domain-containing protein [Muribaculaceae bacterium]
MRASILPLLMLMALCCAAKSVTVVDATDKAPLEMATVIGRSGMIIGVTDSRGTIQVNDNELPVTIHCLGYETTKSEAENDTVQVAPAVYGLNEVVISAAERPIIRVVCFCREYSTGTSGSDTLQLYSEYMTQSFLSFKEVKGYKRGDYQQKRKSSRFVGRIMQNGNDSIFLPENDDEITLLSWSDLINGVPRDTGKESSGIIAGQETDTIMGDFGPKVITRKKNGVYSIWNDYLANNKDHKWSPGILKLLGLTLDLTSFNSTAAFAQSDDNTHNIYDFLYTTCNITILGRGKIFKKIFHVEKPILMESYVEIYPVSITHCTLEEYKELRKDKEELPFQKPQDLTPLSPAVETLVEYLK